MTRKAKIVCTLGPASRSPEMILALARAGMDVARLNFSHGTYEEHAAAIQQIRAVEEKVGRPIAILQDLSGPKIRTGRLRGGRPVTLAAGARLTLTDRDVAGTAALVHVSYPGLAREVRRGNRILLADGLMELRVESARGHQVLCTVVNGGVLGEKKGVNLPGVRLRVSSLTEKDRQDLEFGLAQGVDYVALSFVRSVKDVTAVKELIAAAGRDTPVLAKLEKPEAIDNLEAILDAADGVMVARGDLGVEMAPEAVPVVQKKIIDAALRAKKPVITATQMLESMTNNPRPTRAEASDVANAVFDGTDAVMLSAETATGKYPREAVEMMVRIIRNAEANPSVDPALLRRRKPRHESIAEAICENVAHVAHSLRVRALVVFSRSGASARYVSNYRPAPPIYAFCHGREVERRVQLYWGVRPFALPLVGDTDSVIAAAERSLRESRIVRKGEVLAAVAGSPFGVPGSANLLKLVRVG
jgi:pyruvate kinase